MQVVRRVPEGFGFEAWKQLCREFEPRLPSRFQGMLQALLAPTRVDDPVQTIFLWESRVKVYEEQSGDKVSENIKLAVLQKYLCDGELARHLNLQSSRLTTYDLARKEAINYLRAKQTWTAPGGSDPTDLSPLGKGKGGKKGKGKDKGDKSVKPKECFYCGKPGHNENECRNFSAALRKKSVQPDKAGRYAGVEVDPETGRRKPSGGKGTGAVSPAPGLDTCLLYENDSDQDVYLFPFPMVDECNDSPEDLMALSRQVLFDTGAARSVCPTTFRPDVPIEPSEEIPLHQADGTRVAHFDSKFPSMGVGTQKIEGRFDVRNVTKPIVAAGQVTDRGQGVWLNGDRGFILDVKSARKIEKLLGDNRGFLELRKQKSVCVIP